MCSIESKLIGIKKRLDDLIELLIMHFLSIHGPDDWFLDFILNDEELTEIDFGDGQQEI
jgi:hypothetical protein